MDKNDTKNLIESIKRAEELKKEEAQKSRSMNSYFKNSGKIEQTSAVGPFSGYHTSGKDRKKYGVFLNPNYITRRHNKSKFEAYLKTLEIDLTKYIKIDDKENW